MENNPNACAKCDILVYRELNALKCICMAGFFEIIITLNLGYIEGTLSQCQ